MPVDFERIRWAHDAEPSWLWAAVVNSPFIANYKLGGFDLAPDQIGYLYGYQITTSWPNTFQVWFAETTGPPTTFNYFLVEFSTPGTRLVMLPEPLVTLRPAYDPLAPGAPYRSIFMRSLDAVVPAGQYMQIGYLYSILEVPA